MTDTPTTELSPLVESELDLLTDPARHHLFASLSLTRRHLEKLTIADLTWDGGSFGGSSLREISFVDCTFQGVDFSDAELSSLTFERCTLSDCRFERTQLVSCRFADSSVRDCFWRGTVLLDCVFSGCEAAGNWFESARLRMNLQGGALMHTRLTKCTVEALTLTQVTVESLRLSFCTTQRLAFQHCQLDKVQLLGGSCADFLVHAGKLSDMSWAELSCERAELEDIALASSLYINDCSVAELRMLRCAEVRDLYVYKSRVSKLSLREGLFGGWVTHSSVGPGSSVEHAVLDSFFWDESVCEGLSLQRVSFEGGICARGARFAGLRLIDVRYADGLDVVLDGASFEDSDKFAEGQP